MAKEYQLFFFFFYSCWTREQIEWIEYLDEKKAQKANSNAALRYKHMRAALQTIFLRSSDKSEIKSEQSEYFFKQNIHG